MTCPGAKIAWKTQSGTTPIVSLGKEVALQQVTDYSSVTYKEFGFDVNPSEFCPRAGGRADICFQQQSFCLKTPARSQLLLI